MVGTWDVSGDRVFTVDGPYADNDNSSCSKLVASNYTFSNYFYPDGVTVNIYASDPVYKIARVTLQEGGSGTLRFYNIDTQNPDYDPEARICPVVLDPPENTLPLTWSVSSDGVVRIGAEVKGHLTVDNLKDSYDYYDWSFASPSRYIGAINTYRLYRVRP